MLFNHLVRQSPHDLKVCLILKMKPPSPLYIYYHHIHHHDNNHCQNHANHQQFNIIIFMIIILPKSWEEADRQRAEDQSQEVESSKQIDYFWSKIIWNYDTNNENCLHNWYYTSLLNLNKVFWQDQRKICMKSKWSYISSKHN